MQTDTQTKNRTATTSRRGWIRQLACLLGLTIAGEATLSRASQISMQLLHSFDSGSAQSPVNIVHAKDGSVYGMSVSVDNYNERTFFKIDSLGEFTTIARFASNSMPEVFIETLLQGDDGNFYLLANSAVLQIAPEGAWTAFQHPFPDASTSLVWYTSRGTCLIQGRAGDLYSFAFSDGTNTFFRMSTNGTFTALGYLVVAPHAKVLGITQGPDNNLYGVVTPQLGTESIGDGYFFRVTQDGTVTRLSSLTQPYFDQPGIVGSFDGIPYFATYSYASNSMLQVAIDGSVVALPAAFDGPDNYIVSLHRDDAGNFYLHNTYGGAAEGIGSIRKLSSGGLLTKLYAMGPYQNWAISALQPAMDGNVYGIDGSQGNGAVFRLVSAPLLHATPQGQASLALTWDSFVDGVYQVEFASSLAGTNWAPLFQPISATGSTTSVSDFPSPNARFYRVRLLP